jgi:processive 1,2-diacylglycerol beta-glucosyltransferase
VLILSVSAGAGHVSAAKALERAFQIARPDVEVRHEDVMDWSTRLFKRLYAKAYLRLVEKAPNVLKIIYDQLDTPWQKRRMAIIERMNTIWMWDLIDDFKPDLIVCTHFLPAELIARRRSKGRFSTPQVIAVTDFDCHAMWLVREYEQYFVAHEQTKEYMAKVGIDADRIAVTGIPINPIFAEAKDAVAMRLKHGLQPDKNTILVSGGGFGVGPVEDVLNSLEEIRNPAQIVVVCGRNEDLKARVEQRAAKQPPHLSIKAIGFTKEMDELMAAATLIVSKPGGLTTSEALARGLAFVVVNPIPGQEERNATMLLENGAAVQCNDVEILASKIDAVLDNPDKLATMRENARKLARPNAALEIVHRLTPLIISK